MKKSAVLASTLAIACSGLVLSAAELKSGLEPGDAPAAFTVHDVTGPSKGRSLCYRCQYGNRPVVSIFAREIDGEVADLIKQVDATVGQNKEQQMKAFVVLLTDDRTAAEQKLAAVAKQNNIAHVPLTIFENAQGPDAYQISSNADVSVMMWVDSGVKVNHAFAKGALNKQAVKSIVADTSKILN